MDLHGNLKKKIAVNDQIIDTFSKRVNELKAFVQHKDNQLDDLRATKERIKERCLDHGAKLSQHNIRTLERQHQKEESSVRAVLADAKSSLKDATETDQRLADRLKRKDFQLGCNEAVIRQMERMMDTSVVNRKKLFTESETGEIRKWAAETKHVNDAALTGYLSIVNNGRPDGQKISAAQLRTKLNNERIRMRNNNK